MQEESSCSLSITRKAFVLGSAGLAMGASLISPAIASNDQAPMSADAALAKLKAGNDTFVRVMSQTRQQTIAERKALAQGQQPFASILACADSRTTPEIIFNQGLGDIFVVRVAGNVATTTEIASLEYAAAELKSPLIVVLGHSSCGAVKAAIEVYKGETFPGAIQKLATIIEPAVKATKGKPGDWVKNSILQNVQMSINTLQASTVLSGLVKTGTLKIVGGYEDIGSGKVQFL